MKGYSIESNSWQEIVDEHQLLVFANNDNVDKAIKSLQKSGFKVEPIVLYNKTEIYNRKGE